jgi:C-terminal processing protease CtpA/Prc
MAGDVTAAAMTLLAQSEALIIDLRQNGGGSGVALMAAYLFDKGAQPLSGTYDRPSNKLEPTVTPEWVPGRRFGSRKPLFILISKKTFSAAEAFAYDLQALKRATIVGETSGGGANPFEYRPVRSGFFLSLSEQLSVNPITGKNWQDIGVKPDVPVAPETALERALALARAAIGKNAGGGTDEDAKNATQ